MIVLAAALILALAVSAAGALFAEGSAAVLFDAAGPLTQYGLPLVGTVVDTAMLLVLGGCVLAAWILPAAAPVGPQRTRILQIVAGAAVVWTLGDIAHLLLSYSLATGQSLGSGRFGSDLPVYLASDLGRWLIVGILLAAAASVTALTGTSRSTAVITGALAALALFGKAMTGHASGGSDHETATSSLLFHLAAVAVWVGPLLLLQLIRVDDAALRARIIRRFSAVALIAWTVLALSGVWALWVRITSVNDLVAAPYGQLATGKILLLLVLGAAGWGQRRLIAQRADGFIALARLEAVLMMLAVGLGAAMSSSPPPAPEAEVVPGPAGLLTGFPLPPNPQWGILTELRPDVFAIFTAGILIAVWLWADLPHRRTLVTAMVLFALIQSSSIAVYGKVLFSAHLIQHLVLLAAVGLPLSRLLPSAWIARITGWRRWVLTAAPLAIMVFWYHWPAALWAALDTHTAHLAMVLSAVVAGVIWGAVSRAWAPSVLILPALFAAWGFALTISDRVLAPSWFGATGRTWLADALADQRSAALALVTGAALIAIVQVLQRRTRPRAKIDRA